MNKFWEWMEEKEYTYHKMFVSLDDRDTVDPTKQSLIGFMIEYILKNTPKDYRPIFTVDDIYNKCVETIKEISKRKDKECK